MEPDDAELNWQIRLAERLNRLSRYDALAQKQQELGMAERMRAYAQSWVDRLHHEIATLEQEEHAS